MSDVEQAVGPALPGEPCRVPPRESWSDLEKLVWQEVGSGRIADINTHLSKTADPRRRDDWGPERRLSPTFLETILLHDPWRSAIPRRGVRIVGAWFDETVDLRQAKLPGQLWLDRCRFAVDVLMNGLRAPENVTFYRSAVAGTLKMRAANIGGSLSMRRGEFANLSLHNIRIGDRLLLTGAKVAGTLNMDAAKIGGDLVMNEGADFAEAILRGAEVGGLLNLKRGKFTGVLEMSGATIGASLVMDHGNFHKIIVNNCKIGGELNCTKTTVADLFIMGSTEVRGDFSMRAGHFLEAMLVGSIINGELNLSGAKFSDTFIVMNSTRVGGAVFFGDACFGKDAAFLHAKVGGNFDVTGAKLQDLDLTGTRVEGELCLGTADKPAAWKDDAKLTLRSTSVDVIQDTPCGWPERLELNGAEYRRFGAFGGGTGADVGSRGSRWFIDWLGRGEPYTPQPYHQCARVLREMGHPEMADDVLYAGRERDRREAWRSGNNPRATGLTLLKWFIGYGYGQGYFRSLWWVAGMVVLGTLFLLVSGQIDKVGGSPLAAAFYSFDLLLPIIQLYEPHYKVVLDGFAKYYFAFHKLMGYVLASFLIAGLAGLTK